MHAHSLGSHQATWSNRGLRWSKPKTLNCTWTSRGQKERRGKSETKMQKGQKHPSIQVSTGTQTLPCLPPQLTHYVSKYEKPLQNATALSSRHGKSWAGNVSPVMFLNGKSLGGCECESETRPNPRSTYGTDCGRHGNKGGVSGAKLDRACWERRI